MAEADSKNVKTDSGARKELDWAAHCKDEAYLHLRILYRWKVETEEGLARVLEDSGLTTSQTAGYPLLTNWFEAMPGSVGEFDGMKTDKIFIILNLVLDHIANEDTDEAGDT